MAKTPAMILQELTVHHGLLPPHYDLIHSNVGTHENEFHIEVRIQLPNVQEIYEIGKGPSKKLAKHNAAHKALEALKLKEIFPQDYEVHSPVKQAVNCITKLREICVENKLPKPEFIFVSDLGLAHCREFTFKCKLGSMLTQATEGSKKQSKQVAAQKMLERIKNILPELAEEYNNYEEEDDNADVIKKYIELTPYDVKRNFTIPLIDGDQALTNLMGVKNLTLLDFENWFEIGNEENVRKILNKLELSCEIFELQMTPPIVAVDVCTDSTLTTMGKGCSIEEATKNAFTQLHESLKILMDYQ